MKKYNSKINIIDDIPIRKRSKIEITLDIYMSNPGNFEILDSGRIVEKEILVKAQSKFRRDYEKVKEFFD